jgi:hypothetical protein
LSSRAQLSAIELLASALSGGGALICARWPSDGGEALVIFSDKKVHAGPECVVPLLGLREGTVRNELGLNRPAETDTSSLASKHTNFLLRIELL